MNRTHYEQDTPADTWRISDVLILAILFSVTTALVLGWL